MDISKGLIIADIYLYPPAGYILSSELSQPDVTGHSARPACLKYSTRADDT